MRKKGSPFGMFIRGFVRSFFVIGLLFLVGFGSYKMTMLYYKVTEPPQNEKVEELLKEVASDGIVEDVSKNLIFAVNKKTGKVTDILLEVLNTYTYNLDYITIPVETQFTLSNETYQKVCAINPDIPQIIHLSDLYKYFKNGSIYENGITIIKDLLNVDISYYTEMEEDYFKEIFTNDNGKDVFSDSMLKKIEGLTSEEAVKDYMESFCKNISSNLNTKNRLRYSTTYAKVRIEAVYFHKLSGEKTNSGFEVAIETSQKLISDIIFNDTQYNMKQEENKISDMEEIISSKGFNIQILNGSKISGLATEYKSKLSTDGYQIQSVGNYSGEILTNTKIIVKSSELGKDLMIYFKEPLLVEESLPDGIDIQIVLGTMDKVN